MPNQTQALAIFPPEQDQRCSLSNCGVNKDVVNTLFDTIVKWLRGENLPWTMSKYIKMFSGPENRKVVELLFFHYDGPPEAEVGSGGELNHCKLYLYDDRVSVNFLCEGDDPAALCSLAFKYTMRWFEVHNGLMTFLQEYLNQHLKKVFESEPRRFDGSDDEIQTMTELVDVMRRTQNGDGLLG